MCGTCGCKLTPDLVNFHALGQPDMFDTEGSSKTIPVLERILADNDQQAAHNRTHLNNHNVLTLNIMSAPGSGKTSLLEATVDALGDTIRMGVIEGDLATENDAQRLRAKGIPAIQISTVSACHLDAAMVHRALHQLDLDALEVLFIENVGNLVCPASFDLGQHANVTLLSVPEGDDKPAKYPVMFRATDVMLISKADLLGMIDDFQPEHAISCFRQLANPAPVLTVSARSSGGLQPWLEWLAQRLDQRTAAPRS